MQYTYNMADLYPNLGALTTRAQTLPEPEEQAQLQQINDDETVPTTVSGSKKRSTGLWIFIILAIVILFQIGGRG